MASRTGQLETSILATTQLKPALTGFQINGAEADSNSGSSVAGGGDMNGDGVADVIVGAPGSDAQGSESGQTYVVYGSKAKPSGRKPQSQFPVKKRLTHRGIRVANAARAKTRQGLPLTAKVVKRVAVRGDVRACFVIRRGPVRRLAIRTTGQCRSVRITVRYTAPGNATYLPYARFVTFRTLR